MPRKLTDADVAQIRELGQEGSPKAKIAKQFGVSARHIGRILKGDQRQQLGGLDRDLARQSTVLAVGRFLEGFDLSAGDAVLAETARALAEKLDATRRSSTVGAGMAAPGIARSLIEIVTELRGTVHEPDRLDEIRAKMEARKLANAAAE